MNELLDQMRYALPFALGSLVTAILLSPLRNLLDSVTEAIDAIMNRTVTSIRSGSTTLASLGAWLGARFAEFWSATSRVAVGPIDAINVAIDWLGRQRSSLIQGTFNEEHQAWEIFGAALYATGLALFIYADISIGANNLELMLGADEGTLNLPVWVRQLVIPLIISSAGSAFALGVVLADLFGATHFARWPESLRRPVVAIALLTLLAVLVIAVLIGLSRLTTVEGVNLSEVQLARIQLLGGIAQVIVIVPLLITTALLWWGVLGLAVAWVCLLAVATAPLLVIRFLLAVVRDQGTNIGRGVENGTVALFVVLTVPLRLLAWILDLLREFILVLNPIGKRILELVAYPFTTTASWVLALPRRLRNRERHARVNEMPASVEIVRDNASSTNSAEVDPELQISEQSDDPTSDSITASLPVSGRISINDLLQAAAEKLGDELTPELETRLRREIRALQGRALQTDWQSVWRFGGGYRS